MSKYNDFMSHIRVDGDTHRRVMDAVSKALDEQTASVNEQHISYEDVLKRADEYNKAHGVKAAETTPIRRKAKLSAIQILSIAAAAILVSGVLYVAIKNGSRKSATTENLMQVDNAAETTAAEATTVNQGIKSAVGNDRDSLTATKKGVTAGAKQEDTEAGAETDPVESEEALDENKDKNYFAGHYKISKNIRNLVPFKIKTTETGVTGEESVKALVFTGENGEKMTLYLAEEGTDIAKKVYPEFKGIPAQLQTGNGLKFRAIDTSAGADVQVGPAGPFDAVTWTKNGTAYMMAFGEKKDVNVFISIMENI